MADKYPSTLLVTLADKLAKISDEAVRRDIETEIRKADLDLLAKINEVYASIANVSQTFTVTGWGTFQFGKWYPYTPTFTGFGTPTNVSFCWKREGGSLKVMGKFTSGTTTATEARISLPVSLVSDATLVPSIRLAGPAWIVSADGSAAHTIPLIESGVGYLTFGRTWSSGAAIDNFTKQNANGLTANGIDVSLTDIEIPVSGWN